MTGVQFENELGPLSEEETKVSRKFVKFIMEFAIKECLDNTTPTFCLKGTIARDGFLAHCILSRIKRKDLKFFHVVLLFTELELDLTHLAHKENTQSDTFLWDR